ncbi:MAG TPA: 7TM diverse intracellular signaling domain-containing protein, partial [Chitinophagales bacterium]|nr:7TM diverse intracellular signaling domain-containing protein [Chitinophagales bacterium]
MTALKYINAVAFVSSDTSDNYYYTGLFIFQCQMKKLPLLLIFFVWASHSRADNVLEIKNPQQGVYEVDPRIQIHNLSQVTMALADSGSLLSAQEIASGKFDSLFQPLEKVYPLKANTTYWLKLALVYAAPVKDWWLMISDKDSTLVHYSNHLKTVFYLTDSSGKIISEQKSGVTVPRSQKSIKEIPSVSRALISATGGDRQKIYISIYNSMDFGFGKYPFIELRNPVTGLTTHFFEVLLSMLSSTAFTFFLLSFFFFFFIRDKAYLFFSIYALVLSLHYLILHPQIVFITWFIPEHPQWVLPLWTMLSMSSFIFFFLFGRSFVNLRHLSPITDRLLKIYLLLLSIYILASAALLAIKEKEFVSSPILFMIMFIALAFIVRIAFFRNTLSRFFVVGALWLLTFTVLGIMKNLNIGSIPFNPWPVGQLGQLLIYSLGLAFKIRINEQAKAEADRIKDLDSIKSKFFSNISHEFRTPLTLIQGPLQQIADAAPATGTVTVPARQVHLMKRNADRLLELVNQLLDLSRLDSGKMKLQVIKGDVMQLLKTIAYSFESLAERKQIHYHIQFPDATLISYYDKDKLKKIVTNLLGNAFKYTPEQG